MLLRAPHGNAHASAERPGGVAGDLAADQLAEQVAVHAQHQVDRRARDAGHLGHCVQHLTLTLRVADGGVGPCLLSADLGDDSKALGDQLDDLPVEVAEVVTERGQSGISVGHRGSLRREEWGVRGSWGDARR